MCVVRPMLLDMLIIAPPSLLKSSPGLTSTSHAIYAPAAPVSWLPLTAHHPAERSEYSPSGVWRPVGVADRATGAWGPHRTYTRSAFAS